VKTALPTEVPCLPISCIGDSWLLVAIAACARVKKAENLRGALTDCVCQLFQVLRSAIPDKFANVIEFRFGMTHNSYPTDVTYSDTDVSVFGFGLQ